MLRPPYRILTGEGFCLGYNYVMKIDKEKVYSLLRRIPKGKVTTYKLLAQACNTKGYRAIGQILKCNPDAPRTPCHRVVTSHGTLGGFMGNRDGEFILKKKKLLMAEGILFNGNKLLKFHTRLYSPAQ